MQTLARVLLVLLSLAYPFIIYWGLQSFDAVLLLPLLLVLVTLRWFSDRTSGQRWALALVAVALLLVVVFVGERSGLKLYPVLMNLSFLGLFWSSLYAPQTVIERLARLKEPDLPAAGVRYTRKVTIVWCIFFAVNGCVAAGTVWLADEQLWLLYNGLIAYLLMGTLFAGEWLVRQRVRRGMK